MSRSTEAQNAAYIRGLCVGLCGRPYSAGRTRCSECHTGRGNGSETVAAHGKTTPELLESDMKDPAPAGNRPGIGQADKEPDVLQISAPPRPPSRITPLEFGGARG